MQLLVECPDFYLLFFIQGHGSSAMVYSAIYLPYNKRVAIKVIDLDMFERNQIDELRVVVKLNQKRIIPEHSF